MSEVISPARCLRACSSLVLLCLLAWAWPCRADNLGAIGTGAAVILVLLVFAVLVFVFMITFIVLAVILGRRVRSAAPRGPVLVPVTRGLVGLWYLLAVAPGLVSLQGSLEDAALMLGIGLAGGLPAHIPSVIVLVRASALARKAREQQAQG